ncbi:MAG: hypothetical protein ACTS2F_22390 [Thainema sp.]
MKYDFWDDFIIEGTEDYVGLWQIISGLKEKFPQANSAEIRSMTVEAIREVLETGFMHLGMFESKAEKISEAKSRTYSSSDGNPREAIQQLWELHSGKNLEYKVWDLDIDSSIQRIETEWDELGREPNIGEIAWLETSEKGEKEAERILEARKASTD